MRNYLTLLLTGCFNHNVEAPPVEPQDTIEIPHESLTMNIDFSKLGMQIKEGEPGSKWLLNALLDEGEQNILDVYFRNTNVPTQFYIRLGNNGGTPAVPADTTTLTGITEVTGTGYAAELVARNTTDWGAPALDAGDYQIESNVVTFTNTDVSASWTAADFAYLATTSDNTGLLISAVALSVSRVVLAGNGLSVSIKQKGK